MIGGDYEGAIEFCRRAVKLDPSRRDAYNYLGKALLNTGDKNGAIENFRKAIEVDPGYK